MSWSEVADGVFRRRYEPWDVTVAVVRGVDGLLLVDTRASPAQGRELRRDLAALSDLPVRRVVNTHAHFDHVLGNEAFAGVAIVGHERLAAQHGRSVDGADGAAPVPPTELVGDQQVLDIGGRAVELWHPGRGHTDHDLLVHVPDAGVWLVGDVIEESGPPAYGDDAYPLEWPASVAALRDRTGPDEVVVPGHGEPVGRAFVARQQADLAGVTELIRALHAAGIPAGAAVAEGGDRWPFPPPGLVDAVARAYEVLDLGVTSE